MTKTYSDKIEPSYAKNTNEAAKEYKTVVADIIDAKKKTLIVEYGCGFGAFAIDGIKWNISKNVIKNKYIEYVGVDIDEVNLLEMSSQAKQNGFDESILFSSPKFLLVQGTDLAIGSNSVHLVYLVLTLHDVTQIDHLIDVFYNIFRILRKNGKLIIYDKSSDTESDEVKYILWTKEDFRYLLNFLPDFDLELYPSYSSSRNRFEIINKIIKKSNFFPDYNQLSEVFVSVFQYLEKKYRELIDELEITQLQTGGKDKILEKIYKDIHSAVAGEIVKKLGEKSPDIIHKENKDLVKILKNSFQIARLDKNTRSRRRVLYKLLVQTDRVLMTNSDFDALELKARLWRQISLEEKSYKKFNNATEKTAQAFDDLFSYQLTPVQKFYAVQWFTEWAIDFSQIARASSDFNKIVSRLNKAIRFLGEQLSPLITNERKCAIFCMRSKCRRALASLIQRRGNVRKASKREIEKHRRIALSDAEKGYGALNNSLSELELALCLFSNSKTVFSDKAKRGMILLNKAYGDGSNILAGYELTKQLRMRHLHSEAIKVFKNIAERDSDINRFHSSVTYFSAAIIGSYYDSPKSNEIKSDAFLALKYLDQLISHEHHKAKDIVDYCYIVPDRKPRIFKNSYQRSYS